MAEKGTIFLSFLTLPIIHVDDILLKVPDIVPKLNNLLYELTEVNWHDLGIQLDVPAYILSEASARGTPQNLVNCQTSSSIGYGMESQAGRRLLKL